MIAVSLLAVGVLLVAGCASAPADDARLTYAVKTAFVNDAEFLREPDVAIATVAGVVHLTGSVSDQVLKDRLERLARAVPGVRAVRNDITVKYVFHERP